MIERERDRERQRERERYIYRQTETGLATIPSFPLDDLSSLDVFLFLLNCIRFLCYFLYSFIGNVYELGFIKKKKYRFII